MSRTDQQNGRDAQASTDVSGAVTRYQWRHLWPASFA
jgi:hypothetical protein